MNESFFLPLRLLLLGYGNVAQAFLPLLASRSEWLAHQFSVRPVISGIGTRRHGFYIHPEGIDARTLASETHPLHWFSSKSNQVEDAEAFLQAGRMAGASLVYIGKPKGPIELAPGSELTPHMVKREGMRSLSTEEIRTAAAQGTPLRLVSEASCQNGNIVAEVSPQPLHADDILHIAKGPASIISLTSEAMGTITLIEHEPMVVQTAYGVLSDLITMLQQRC